MGSTRKVQFDNEPATANTTNMVAQYMGITRQNREIKSRSTSIFLSIAFAQNRNPLAIKKSETQPPPRYA
jgi:hypothetical protein